MFFTRRPSTNLYTKIFILKIKYFPVADIRRWNKKYNCLRTLKEELCILHQGTLPLIDPEYIPTEDRKCSDTVQIPNIPQR